jgi:hypothetical protein
VPANKEENMEDENSEVNILKEKDNILNFKNKVHAHETLH